ncbi:MAG TPA: hypothetical protein VLM85_26405 [Polyangiaceae bacterium]|nr:hypothetical protein [Polyangiaceae bacterium]
MVSEFFAAAGKLYKTGRFTFGLERRGGEARALFSADGRKPTWMRGQATASPGGFHFVVDQPARNDQPGLHAEGDVAHGAVTSLSVRDRDPKMKTPLPTAIEPLASPDFAQTYAGSLGPRLRVRAKLERKGSKLTGVYRYARSTQDLRLDGHVDAGLVFALDERGEKGAVTGHFDGVLLGSDAALARWSSPDGKRTYPVTLAGGAAYPEIHPLAQGGRVVPQEKFTEVAPSCEDTRIVPALQGLPSASGQASINRALSAMADAFGPPLTRDDCKGATEELPYQHEQGYAVLGERPGYVGLQLSLEEFTGGAHGNYAARCVVVDLAKSEVVRLGQQLTPVGRAKLESLVIASLQKQNGVTALSDAGFYDDHPHIGPDTDVCFEMKGAQPILHVEFGLYEVTPYVMGAPDAALDAKDASGIFQPGTAGAALFP